MSRIRDHVLKWLFEKFLQILTIGGAVTLFIWALFGAPFAMMVALMTIFMLILVLSLIFILWKAGY